jgi:hypothetical protein
MMVKMTLSNSALAVGAPVKGAHRVTCATLKCRVGESPEMTDREMRQRAHAVGDEEWWQEPVLVKCHRRWLLFGSIEWHGMSNTHQRRGKVNIWIIDASDQVSRRGFARRSHVIQRQSAPDGHGQAGTLVRRSDSALVLVGVLLQHR